MFYENQYQLAYVTPDLDQGIALLEQQYGVPAFKGLGGDNFVENNVWTPDGDRDIGMRVAIATVGHLTIEVLQPVSGATEIFTDMLLPGQPLRLHHIGMRTNDLDAVRAGHEAAGRQIVMAGGYKLAKFIYVDARATLGHFLEYAQAPAEHWDR